ncbi:MAG TPA: group II intron reverse transcriptase/maturase, partial [Gammaproteobacteria bacterium]|nr:group II intron reverse transcriptase/maturase [Gammaproteobacteria bacterium]
MEPVTLDAVLTDSNLFDAWAKVRGNKGCAGIDGQTLEDFAKDLMANLDLLRMEVRSGSYRPLPLLRVHIDKKSGGKRPLSIPAVRDRVLQTAMALVLTPLFEAEFEDVSFAYRKGRSVDQAVQRVIRLRDEGYRWVVDADIDDFFDEIDHELLMAEVAALVGDEEILRLIRQWLTGRVVDGKRRWRLKKGVPQGSPISPLLSNLYLDHLDEALLGENLKLIRFADDFIILCKKRRRAEEALELTEEVLEALKLSINEDKTRLVNFRRGFRFLGVQFIRSLAFKSKYPVPGPVLESLSRIGEQGSGVMSSAQALEMAARKPQNAMQLAVAEVGLDEDDFSDAPVHPVESGAAPQPSDDGAPARHDSRLRTLYLMEHGYV